MPKMRAVQISRQGGPLELIERNPKTWTWASEAQGASLWGMP